MANYEAYTRNNSDLLADFKKNWEGKISLSQYGQMHYQNYGKKEGRSMPGGSSGGSDSGPKKFTVDGVEYPRATSNNIFGSNPNKGYKARATMEGGTRGGNRVAPGAIGGVNMYMTKDGRRAFQHGGVGYVELKPGGGRFKSTVGRSGGGFVNISEYTHKEEEKPAAPAGESGGGSHSGGGSSSSSSRPSYAPAPGGSTSSTSVNAEITATQQALNAAISAINAMASGYGTSSTAASPFPDAPASVKTYDDYVKWKRSQSAQTGYLSTVTTGSTGLSDDEMDENVVVTALTS